MHRIDTKEKRLSVQQGNINRLLANGWTKEEYKTLQIFTIKEVNFMLKVFRDTVSEATIFKAYRTEEQMNEAIKNVKASYDRVKEYKANRPNQKSSTANCADLIRAELKTAFPGVKFSVKSSIFAGGDAVHIDWSDGPTTDMVTDITGKYQYGHFDGMNDLYEYSNRQDFAQAKYVQEQRSMSNEIETILLPVAREIFAKHEFSHIHSAENFLYRIFCKTPIPVGAKITGISESGKNTGSLEDFYKIDFEAKEEEAKPAKVETLPGTINIIKYSEKAIAVIGDTKPVKDTLKELGGSFNFRLTCGPGWIFPMSKLAQIQTALTSCSKSA